SILITSAYLFNLGFKYIFQNSSWKVKQAVLVGIFIVAGWLTMFFGVTEKEYTLFDLRTVPLIFGTLFFRDPRLVLLIGAGISLSRYTFAGITPQAITGSINIMLLGCLAALLVNIYRKKAWSYKKKALVSILSINTLQVIGIAMFGAIPTHLYLSKVVPHTYPAAILVGSFFVFIMRDFYEEQLRTQKLKRMNHILRHRTRELREKARELQLSSKYKSDFIANMSHELKTPLNSIMAMSQLLQEDVEQREERISYADFIHTSGKELLQKINNILDIASVETGKMKILWELVSVEDMIQLMQYQFQTMTEQKGLGFEVHIAANVSASIVTDANRLIQILRNLLMNAVKFTEHGGISVLVHIDQTIEASQPELAVSHEHKHTNMSLWPFSQNGLVQQNIQNVSTQWVVFTVCDTGVGIDQDKQQLIFEAFYQEDSALTRRYEGTGLGLSISLKLARLLGGTLTLHSVKGEGSRFSLRLPVYPLLDQKNCKTDS
ncbi:sensor histidine kinase, partial [Paenibacillus alginolyticus]